MTSEALYQAIWETVERYVSDGSECEELTNELWELVLEDGIDGARQRNRDRTATFIMGTIWGK